jgi:NTP pyrophosphatase (non-canonical NTP hydrolase)
MNDIDSYAEWTEKLWLASGSREIGERDHTIMGFGLQGETGELAEVVLDMLALVGHEGRVSEILKKRVRDGHFDRDRLKKELGDIAYYWARICKAYAMLPSEVLAANVKKIESRRARSVMHGSGDNR